MRRHWKHLLRALACLSWLFMRDARAIISCSLPAFTDVQAVYRPGANIDSNNVGTMTLRCDRSASDPTTQTYWIGIDTSNPSMTLAGYSLNYMIYTDAGYSQPWGNANSGAELSGQISFLGDSLSSSVTHYYYLRIPRTNLGQPASALPYKYQSAPIDINLRLSSLGPAQSQGKLQPSALVPAECSITTPPSTLTLNYTSFSQSSITGSVGFGVMCNQNLPYNVALDTTVGSLMELQYSLAISPTGQQTGSGTSNPFTITGTIAPGQAGRCTGGVCNASRSHTITVSY